MGHCPNGGDLGVADYMEVCWAGAGPWAGALMKRREILTTASDVLSGRPADLPGGEQIISLCLSVFLSVSVSVSVSIDHSASVSV
jgi:hypothetical protein